MDGREEETCERSDRKMGSRFGGGGTVRKGEEKRASTLLFLAGQPDIPWHENSSIQPFLLSSHDPHLMLWVFSFPLS